MGVYHLMGLGRSPGAAIGPVSFLAHRYRRWNDDDRAFFARSGEAAHRAAQQRVGDIQVIVFFTTREILGGEVLSFPYVDNPPGVLTSNPSIGPRPVCGGMAELLAKEWPAVAPGRSEAAVFWCEVDRRDIQATYARAVAVVAALQAVGGLGKELWVNLTGGTNVINFALQLAAALSGAVARIYYVQASDERAERCVRWTQESGYWVDLPLLPLVLGEVGLAVVELLQAHGAMPVSEIRSRLLQGPHWYALQDLDEDTFRKMHMDPLWKLGIVETTAAAYDVGSRWGVIAPYHAMLREIWRDPPTIEELARREVWLRREVVHFHR